MIHQLKCEKKYFEDVISGKKTFEVRKNDRNFKVGDYLALNEIDFDENYPFSDEEIKVETGRSSLFKVIYILDAVEYCKDGYVIIGIAPCHIDFKSPGYIAHLLKN